MRVGYLGPEGSFSYEVTRCYYGEEELVPFATITDCLYGVEEDYVDMIVVPIENSYEGTVNETLDFLYHKGSLFVCREIIMSIHQTLAIHPSMKGQEQGLQKIYSHSQGLAQTKDYLHDNFPKASKIVMSSTARSAELVAAEGENQPIGAICSKQAAELFGLSIVEDNVEDSQTNQTRFWCIQKTQTDRESSVQKISICLTLAKDQPGSLHQFLSAFSWRNINLSKIESRPLKTHLGDYFFLLDIIVDCPISLIYLAFEEIKLLNGQIKELGAYTIINFQES